MNKIIFAAAFLTIFVSACASNKKDSEELDRRIKAEPRISSPAEIANRAAEILSNSPGITTEQRVKLSKIYTKTYLEALEIRTEIGQTLSLFFKIIASKHSQSKEVAMIKSKLAALDKKRLTLMFEAMDEVQKVIGYGVDEDTKEQMFKKFQVYELDINLSQNERGVK